ncbi:protein-tyrosine-phosphatase [bacterium]|nr:protein-tyrosine-phosphatase [bacterium]
MTVYPEINNFINTVESEQNLIPVKRKSALEELADYVTSKSENNQPIQLTFICTHNSRRSQLAQIWAKVAADYCGIVNISCYSAGTEATAFNPRAVAAIKRAGFKIEVSEPDNNPRYLVYFSEKTSPVTCFSKKLDDQFNPQKDFCAIMTCSDADEACPVVFGCDERIALPFDDPKAFDNTDQETKKYDERCRQIAREMFYVFQTVKEKPGS